jgi:AraC family transcriptional regulator, transcriptional activator of pobA
MPLVNEQPKAPVLTFDRAAPDAPPIEVRRLGRAAAGRAPKGLHAHRFPVVLYFERKGGVHRVGAREWPVESGDVHFVAPGEVHDWAGLGKEPRGWSLLFMPDAVEGPSSLSRAAVPQPDDRLWLPFVRSADRPPRANVPAAQRPLWEERFALLCREMQRKRFGYEEIAQSYLRIILVELSRLIAPSIVGFSARQQPLLAELFAVVERRFAERLSTSQVARALSLSPGHLTTTVRELTGRTVLQWIVERRMAEARRRLIDTDEDIDVLGERCGFSDPTHFIRTFRRHHQTTPQAWRRANR